MPINKRKAVTAAVSLTVFIAAFRLLLSTRYSDKASFSSALSFAEGELLWFSAVVAFGVYGEARQTEWWKDRHSLFASWVALGLVGELMADAQIWRASASLQTVSDALLADAETKASIAITKAAKADERAASANGRATDAALALQKWQNQRHLDSDRSLKLYFGLLTSLADIEIKEDRIAIGPFFPSAENIVFSEALVRVFAYLNFVPRFENVTAKFGSEFTMGIVVIAPAGDERKKQIAEKIAAALNAEDFGTSVQIKGSADHLIIAVGEPAPLYLRREPGYGAH